MRYLCDLEGFDGCFVEFSERWTRAEMRNVWNVEGSAYWQLVRGKVTAVKLGDVSSPEELTETALDEMDWLLFRWFSGAILKAITDLQSLGEAAGRLLFEPSEATGQNQTP